MGLSTRRWHFWIDRGGTFTDCIARNPNTGELSVTKVLSSDAAPLLAIRQALRLRPEAPIPPCDVRMGTTVATNALLERKGAAVGLVITKGFGDVLEIGTQARPDLFSLHIRKPDRLYREVLEIDARADPQGRILARPDSAELKRQLAAMRERGVESVAIVVLHAYASPILESEIAEVATQVGFEHVACSHEVARELGLVARGDTSTVDAYLTPLLRRYVNNLLTQLPGSSLRLMQSGGGLADARAFRGPNAILSGPAGGVIAYGAIAQSLGLRRAIGFDMGGTSTDVSRFAGEPERVYEYEIAGVRLRTPTLSIVTVAAGGGSICRFDGHQLSVGPESAGADPGPLCYGSARATELTLTDINFALGRLAPDRFQFPIASDRVTAALESLQQKVHARGAAMSNLEIAEGFYTIACHNMAEAIRRVSLARGFDVRDHALMVFGGAGGQHACALATRLKMRAVVFHRLGGVLSAYGMGLAPVAWHGEADAGREELTSTSLLASGELAERLEAEGRAALAAQGFSRDHPSCVHRVDLRYRGTETSLVLKRASLAELVTTFTQRHHQLFGYARKGHPIELVNVRVELRAEGLAATPPTPRSRTARQPPEPLRYTCLFHGGSVLEGVPVYERESLVAGVRLKGPALILDATSTTVIDPEFELEALTEGVLIATREEHGSPSLLAPPSSRPRASASEPSRPFSNPPSSSPRRCGNQEPDPILLDVMGNLFMSIAEQMGHVLKRTALSTNIRERLDFSCAIFDRDAALVANAPHIPVHLGAMGESVRAVVAAHRDINPGEVFATNDPAQGGSHLPDITVVAPVFAGDGHPAFFVAARGHHADIGGITPGSMPANSTSLEEEGVVLRNLKIVHEGRFAHESVLKVLRQARFPARHPSQNIADLEAQVAATQMGVRLLREITEEYGISMVQSYMQHIQHNAASKVVEQIERLERRELKMHDYLDEGSCIAVTLRPQGRELSIDFSGTSPELTHSNLNAPKAVTMAAVIYFVRALVGAPIPLNAGCLRPVRIYIPKGCLLSPQPERAVAGGNVETSQRIVDVLLGAAGCAAASQGTMNNLTLGNDAFGYYETIAGGAGAGPGFSGASAVHTHMTNTRLTDAEVLEAKFPLRVRELSIRRGSGGDGRFRGGDGICREIEALESMRLSLLSERRERPPFGLAGGSTGARGCDSINGHKIGGKTSVQLETGDVIRIETPGGGGYGS